jgi:predicted phosphodiesterase
VKFGAISCSQLCSKYQQLSHLKTWYHYAQEEEGIEDVLNMGDLVDGEKVYRGHEYEIFLHGEKAQREYTIEHYPTIKRTWVIAGNHDDSYYKLVGTDILENIALARPDIKYVGKYGAYPIITLGNRKLKIYMSHGEGGCAYARSYKLQRKIEQFSSEAKPDIYFLGHYHVNCYLPQYRNVMGLMMPCFQAQTPYLRRRGLNPEIGGWIIRLRVNDVGRKNSIVEMNNSYYPFYKVIEKDY